MATNGRTNCCVVEITARRITAWLVVAFVLGGIAFCVTRSAGWRVEGQVAAALGGIWFVIYGGGTTWQLCYENPNHPSFTCWRVVTQAFSYGAWAAVGWLAAYKAWALRPMTASDVSLGYVALLAFALLSITGWLPERLPDRLKEVGRS